MRKKSVKKFQDFVGNLKVDKEAVKTEREKQFITQIRHYKLITPLFGGGAETKKADAVKIIRETEIRGQLRFWWRAIRGVGTITEMSQREAEIFGTSATGNKEFGESKVKVFVRITNDGEVIRKTDSSIPRYAVFPLEDNDQLKKNVEFSLEISFPSSAKDEIRKAIWVWETFGGVGGRIRRGFGAIQLTKVDDHNQTSPSCSEVKNYIESKLIDCLAKGEWNQNVPHLSTDTSNVAFSNPSTIKNADNSIIVWKNIVDKLHRFRQSPRNEDVYRGESHWSEPDAIRRITDRHAINNPNDFHSKDREPDHPVGNKFPRGQLGLPIIFKFKNSDVQNGDPTTQTLQGQNYERLSSPLILRPIACSDGAVGIALALSTPREPSGGVMLKQGCISVSTTLLETDIKSIKPMQDASSTETDVVKSFLRYLEI